MLTEEVGVDTLTSSAIVEQSTEEDPIREEGRAVTTEITSFEVYRTVQHNYTFTLGTMILASPFDGNIQVKRLTIIASRTVVSGDPDIDTEYVDITVKGKGSNFNKNGRVSALSHDFYANLTEIEANAWLAELVQKAREEAQSW